jgi:hypothetical protein
VMARFAKLALRLAQDQEQMTAVRRFGSLANRMYRSLPSPTPTHDD